MGAGVNGLGMSCMGYMGYISYRVPGVGEAEHAGNSWNLVTYVTRLG
jgi:hypothetical protein